MRIFSTEETDGIAGNLIFAIIAQGVGLISSFLTSLVLPKFLGVQDYAYWQLFLLYSSYAGFGLLGLNDGIYLRLGGKRYSELPFGELKAQQLVVFVSQMFVAAVCLAAVVGAAFDPYKMLVFVLVIILGLSMNLTQCLRYVFQCTNLTRISSIADLIHKASFLLCMATLLLLGLESSLPFIICYVVCQTVALIYVFICARKIFLAKTVYRGVLQTCFDDVRAGLKIMVSYYADSLIVGFTRMITEWELGLQVFGRLSLSFSLTNFFLGFIGQVAMVAFPVLKRLDLTRQRSKYIEIRSLLHVVLPVAYLSYVPIKLILGLWLPSYETSLVYLALTLPLCVYSCKTNFLFDTYMKIGRNEGALCAINIGAMLVNSVFAFVGISMFQSVELATCGIVATVALRDLIFEVFMAKQFHDSYIKTCLSEALITVCFMSASWCLGEWSMLVMLGALFVYLFVFSKDEVGVTLGFIKARLSR